MEKNINLCCKTKNLVLWRVKCCNAIAGILGTIKIKFELKRIKPNPKKIQKKYLHVS